MSKLAFAVLGLWVIASGCDFLGFGDSDSGVYKIAFLSRRIPNSADWLLYIMDSDGGRQERLFDKTLDYAWPVPSPDRSRIAFTGQHANLDYTHFEYALYILDLADRSTHLLASSTRRCGAPTWSPSGDQIAFVMSRGDGEQENSLYVTDPAGVHVRMLTEQGDARGPSWSSDGYSIAFSMNLEGKLGGIYLISPDGSGLKKIVDNGHGPSWSPGGGQIAFVSEKTGAAQIYTVNADGSDVKQLTSSFTPSWDSGYPDFGNSTPAWSPDGEQIAYVSYPDGVPDVYVMNSDGSRKRRLTKTGTRDEYPSWSWNGRDILFVSNRNYVEGNAEIFIMKRDGSAQRPLSNYASDDVLPVWVHVP